MVAKKTPEKKLVALKKVTTPDKTFEKGEVIEVKLSTEEEERLIELKAAENKFVEYDGKDD